LFIRPDVSNHETVTALNLAEVNVFSKKEIIRHIHTKMVLNESTLLAMTANITDFDLYRNLNIGILTHSPTEAEKAKRDFERLVEPHAPNTRLFVLVLNPSPRSKIRGYGNPLTPPSFFPANSEQIRRCSRSPR